MLIRLEVISAFVKLVFLDKSVTQIWIIVKKSRVIASDQQFVLTKIMITIAVVLKDGKERIALKVRT